jgi:O-antigen/teichoic acid export membrane protein
MASPRNSPQGGQGSEWSGRTLNSEGATSPELTRNTSVAALSLAMNDTRLAGRAPPRPTRMAVSNDHKLISSWPSRWLELARTRGLALADQAVVSGTSFLTAVMIARWAFPDELGIYAMAISLLVSWVAVQESLVLLPYTIHRHRLQAISTEHAGSYLALSSLFSIVAVAMFSMAALGLSTATAPHGLVTATFVLAAAVPFASLREFGRRFSFAHLRVLQSLALDLAASAVQLGGLAWLAWTDQLSAVTACATIGVAYAVPSIAWLYFSRDSFAIQKGQLRKTMRRSWLFGKWLLATRIAESLHAQAVYWLLALAIGTAATGAYAACMSIVSFANPIILGLFNILLPQASLALAKGGASRLQREAIRDALLLSAAMALFCVLVAFGGERAMHLLFHGPQYEGQGHTLLVLALALLPSALGMPAANALAAIERPHGIFWASLAAMVVTVVLVWFLMLKWGLVGAAYGLLAGNAVGTLGRWAAFLCLVQQLNPQAAPNAAASLTSPTPIVNR